MSLTEIMPLAYRNMYSQPCSPSLSAFLSSLLRYVRTCVEFSGLVLR